MKYKNEEREKEGFTIDKVSEFTQKKAIASNSITILNAANTISFKDRKFDYCDIPNANLSD